MNLLFVLRCAPVAVLIIAACAEVPAPPVVVRDSLGITITENHEAAWAVGTEWRIDSVPLLTIAPEGVEQRVVGAARLSDGRIVVVDAARRELRFHDDESGRLIARAGAPGHGPGQFSAPGDLLVGPGDTLYVWDEPWHGLVVFDGQGEHVRTERVGRPARVYDLFAWDQLRPPLLSSPRALLENGLFEAADSVHGFAVIARLRLEFDRTDTLITFVTDPRRELRDVVVVATGPVAEETFVGRVRSREFLRFEGLHLRDIVRTSVQPLPLEHDDEDVTTQPLYTSLFADRTGAMWMRLHGRRSWLVFDATGRELGELIVPGDLRPLDAGADYLLGLDSTGSRGDRVVLFRVHR